jgi:hypothetical protein
LIKPKEVTASPPAPPPGEASSTPGSESADAIAPADPAAASTPPTSEKVVLAEEAAPNGAGSDATAQEGAPEPAPPSANPFDKEAARIALEVAGARAMSCRQEGDPSGTARMLVTFAPSGRVTTATVAGPPYAGTALGGCLATAFRGAIVPAYAGSPVTVSKTVVIR